MPFLFRVCVLRGFSFLCGKSLPLALFKFIMLFNCRVCSLVVVVFHGVDVLSTLIVLCVCVSTCHGTVVALFPLVLFLHPVRINFCLPIFQRRKMGSPHAM